MACHPAEIEELRAWYLETIGYDPFEDGATLAEVRQTRAEYEAEVRALAPWRISANA